jgi:hypothetical protein
MPDACKKQSRILTDFPRELDQGAAKRSVCSKALLPTIRMQFQYG